MPASVAKPDALPWLALREAISSMSGPGVAVSARQAIEKRAKVERSIMSSRCQSSVHQRGLRAAEIGRAELREVQAAQPGIAVQRGKGRVGFGERRQGREAGEA